MKLLAPWHKCQKWKVENQISLANVGYLDIRVKFDDEGNPVFVHNNITYKVPISVYLYIYSHLNLKKPIPCRLMLDIRKKPEDADHQIMLFKKLIREWKSDWNMRKILIIDEARIYWDWQHPLIKSKYNIVEVHTSVCSPWYKYILGTKWFAKKHNIQLSENQKCDKKVVYLIDYVNIQN